MSAAEQSRRASPPEICSIHNLRDVLSFDGLRIVLSEAAPPEKSLISVLREASQRSEKRTVVLAFGPEGGWTEDELSSFIHAGWIEASLGPNILRAETAAIAAVAIAASMLNAQADEND